RAAGGRRRGPRKVLQVEPEADAGRVVAVAEGAADRERAALADLLRVAHRQGALAVLPAGADRDAATLATSAGGVHRHVHHRRAHRTHPVDALVLLAQPRAEVVAQLLELVVERGELRIGVGV